MTDNDNFIHETAIFSIFLTEALPVRNNNIHSFTIQC